MDEGPQGRVGALRRGCLRWFNAPEPGPSPRTDYVSAVERKHYDVTDGESIRFATSSISTYFKTSRQQSTESIDFRQRGLLIFKANEHGSINFEASKL